MVFVYLVCIIFIVDFKRGTLSGSSIRTDKPLMSSYKFDYDLNMYFGVKDFEKIKTTDQIYEFIEKLNNKKLWVD